MIKQENVLNAPVTKADRFALPGGDLREAAQKTLGHKRDLTTALLAGVNEVAKSPIPDVCKFALAFKAALAGNPPSNYAELKKAAIAAAQTA